MKMIGSGVHFLLSACDGVQPGSFGINFLLEASACNEVQLGSIGKHVDPFCSWIAVVPFRGFWSSICDYSLPCCPLPSSVAHVDQRASRTIVEMHGGRRGGVGGREGMGRWSACVSTVRHAWGGTGFELASRRC